MLSSFSNIFSSEATGPNEAKFYMEPPWVGGKKFCSNSHGHMTKVRWPPCPYMVKKLKKSSSPEPKKTMTLKVGMQHRVLEYYQVCSNDDPGLTLTYFTAVSIWSIVLLYEKKVKQWIFQKLL